MFSLKRENDILIDDTLKPDIEISTSINDYINGIDPIFENIVNKY
ncbi:hypothetical protein [Clostridium sp. BJN0013]